MLRNPTLALRFCAAFFAACALSLLPFPASADVPTADTPKTIRVQGREITLKNLTNPLSADPANLSRHIKAGGEVYIKNCFLCHGGGLDGKGLFGDRFFPPPADFTHPMSAAARSQSYAFWRIMKGGPGLPDKFSPWDSSMPAWENQLSEEQVWQVILFIRAAASEKKDSAVLTASPTLERGKEVYAQKCVLCHGGSGKGDGPSADYSSPRPRNFTKGHIKIRSTPFGKIPTDRDIFNVITRGLPGTTMPGWERLPASDRWSLVIFLKSLAKKFAKFKAKGKTHQIILVPDPPPFSLQSLASGKQLFLQSCSGCHGVKGRGDGPSTVKVVDIGSDSIWPRNLSKPWTFRRGHSRKDIFMTLRTGLSTTAMPRFSKRIFNDQQIWDIVHYVQTLSPPQKPEIKKLLQVKKIEGELPLSPEDSVWQTAESRYIPVGGQIIQKKKLYFPAIDSLALKAVHNGIGISIKLHWDDPSYDPAMTEHALASPPPPLPRHLQVTDEETEKMDPQEFPDAIAVQFPVDANADGPKPYFLNGDAGRPVNLWKWESTRNRTEESNATGLNEWKPQPNASQGVVSKSAYRYGRYSLVLNRKLQTRDEKNDIQFQPGIKIPIAFNVWDGSQDENGTQKAISSWFEMILE